MLSISNYVDMTKLSSYVVATCNVLYDKLSSDLGYASDLSQPDVNLTQTKTDLEDKLSDYIGYVQPDKYQDESANIRLYADDGWYGKIITSYSNPVHIIGNIYLGSAINASTKIVLDNLEIKFIINCAAEIKNRFDKELQYKKYSLYDNNVNCIAEALDNCYQDIEEFQSSTVGNILVHCMMGRSRSVAVVTYYIMRKHRHEDGSSYTIDEALEFIKAKKPDINPTFRLTKDVIKAIKLLMERNQKDNILENDSEFVININDSVINLSMHTSTNTMHTSTNTMQTSPDTMHTSTNTFASCSVTDSFAISVTSSVIENYKEADKQN